MELAKPGAGLPSIERLTIKYLFVPSLRIFITWDIALILLKREIRLIKELLEPFDSEFLQKQIIIDRTFAIEDDTRQFSINMVLEHLTIAGTMLFDLMKNLSDEKVPEGKITIESVKPHENKQNQLDEFLSFYYEYFEYIENHSKKQSKAKKRHPWFIEFNNFDWSVFMYMHTFVHRRQIESIIENLKANHE